MGDQRAVQTKNTETSLQRKAAIAPHPLLATRSPVHPVLQLQGQVGNRGVTQLIQANKQVSQTVGSPGQPLDLATRTLMESRFGYDFSEIRIHTDSQAIESAQAIQARAYTVGKNIVFGKDHYAPHTASGQRLIAHELVHTIQQSGNGLRAGQPFEVTQPTDTAEREADKAADAVISNESVTITSHSLSKIGRNVGDDPLRDFIKSSRESIHEYFQDEAYFDFLNEIGNPQLNKASLLEKIRYLDQAQLKKAIDRMGNRYMTDIAGSSAGVEVLQAIKSKLPKGPWVDQLDLALNVRSTGTEAVLLTKVTPDDQKALDRINRVIPADPHYSDYRKGSGQSGLNVPLRFPVEIYLAGRAVDGGVYYDPNLREDAGLVPTESNIFTISQKQITKVTRNLYPLVFIKLGPKALSSSDAHLQSVMWHEFQHYRRIIDFRQADTDKSSDVKFLEQEYEVPGAKLDNAETEATSIQLADYFDQLSDADFKGYLLYLARFFKEALPDFKQAAIDRLRRVVVRKPNKKARLLKLIDTIRNRTQRENLKELREAIART